MWGSVSKFRVYKLLVQWINCQIMSAKKASKMLSKVYLILMNQLELIGVKKSETLFLIITLR